MKNLLHSKKGSNQYTRKNRGLSRRAWKSIVYLIITMSLVALVGAEAKAQEPQPLISPIPFYMADTQETVMVKGLTYSQSETWEEMKQAAKRLAPIYDYPTKVLISQMALESNRGTSNYCKMRNNCFGIGAYDSNPDNAFSYGNKEQAMIDYMRLIKNRYPEAYKARRNPEKMIELIKNAGYASDPSYVTKIKNLPEWNS